MTGVGDPKTVDLITQDPTTGDYALIMVEYRKWGTSVDQLVELQIKIDNYAAYALNGGLVDAYPDAVDKPVRLQLDCVEAPSTDAAELIEHVSKQLGMRGLRFVVHVLA